VRAFACTKCHAAVAFEAMTCPTCASPVGYLPTARTIVTLDRTAAPQRYTVHLHPGTFWRCLNSAWGCNWLLPAASGEQWCDSCRLTHGRPDTSVTEAVEAWSSTEALKRRLLHQLASLGLPIEGRCPSRPHGLAFELVHVPGQPAVTGHLDGTITIDLTEADDARRAQLRHQFAEPARTMLGHLRHEAGHYYWPHLIDDPASLAGFRALFGDERLPYDQALDDHRAAGPGDWDPARHITAYASSHPAEDWAETFAHYLLLVDATETADAHRVALTDQPRRSWAGIHDIIQRWQQLSAALDSVASSIGADPLYPYELSPLTKEKLVFVHRRINHRLQTHPDRRRTTMRSVAVHRPEPSPSAR
jgi:hypothetical protein